MTPQNATRIARRIVESGLDLTPAQMPGHALTGIELHVSASRIGPEEMTVLMEVYAKYDLLSWSMKAEGDKVVMVFEQLIY